MLDVQCSEKFPSHLGTPGERKAYVNTAKWITRGIHMFLNLNDTFNVGCAARTLADAESSEKATQLANEALSQQCVLLPIFCRPFTFTNILSSTKDEQQHHKTIFNQILDYDPNLKRVLFVDGSDLGLEIFANVSIDYMRVSNLTSHILSLRRWQGKHAVRTARASRKQLINMLDSIMLLFHLSQLLRPNLCVALIIQNLLDYCALLSTWKNSTETHKSKSFLYLLFCY
jgi:hypothetical protein